MKRSPETVLSFVPPDVSGHDCRDESTWLAERKLHLCSSEAAGALGVGRFNSPWSIYAHKTDKIPDSPRDESAIMEAGHRLEPVLGQWFADKTGREVVNPGDYWVESRGILLATPDRFQGTLAPIHQAGAGGYGVLELKCACFKAWKQWEKQVPMPYQIQIQQQMYCCGCDYGSWAVLGNGYDFKIFHVERNEEFIVALVTRLEWWWDTYVVKDRPPPTDPSEATAKALAAIYPEVKIEQVELDSQELVHADADRRHACTNIDGYETVKNLATNKLKAAMGTAELGILPDGSGYSWKKDKRGRTFRRVEKCLKPKTP